MNRQIAGMSLWKLIAAVMVIELVVIAGLGVVFGVLRQAETARLLRAQVVHLEAKVREQGRRFRTQSRLGMVQPAAQTGHAAHFFPAYDMDRLSNEVVRFWIRVPDRLSLAAKLRLIAATLSYVRFGEQPIELLRIENRLGRRVAVINLRDMDADNTWYGRFFQGSTGGGMTTVTLTQTFLQRGYKGEWIDGVRFYLNGKPLVDQDHTALGGTIYRDGTRSE